MRQSREGGGCGVGVAEGVAGPIPRVGIRGGGKGGRGTGVPDRSLGTGRVDGTGGGGTPGVGEELLGDEEEACHPSLLSQKVGGGSEGVRKKAKGGKPEATVETGGRWDEVLLEGELSCESVLRSATRSHALKRMSAKVHECVKRVYGEDFVKRREVARLVKEAYISTDDDSEYGEEEAIIWAEDFKFPEGLGARDAQRLAEAGSLKGAVEELHAGMARARRLSEESIGSLLSEDDEDFDKLMDLLRGVKILTTDDFEPDGLPPELATSEVSAYGARRQQTDV